MVLCCSEQRTPIYGINLSYVVVNVLFLDWIVVTVIRTARVIKKCFEQIIFFFSTIYCLSFSLLNTFAQEYCHCQCIFNFFEL